MPYFSQNKTLTAPLRIKNKLPLIHYSCSFFTPQGKMMSMWGHIVIFLLALYNYPLILLHLHIAFSFIDSTLITLRCVLEVVFKAERNLQYTFGIRHTDCLQQHVGLEQKWILVAPGSHSQAWFCLVSTSIFSSYFSLSSILVFSVSVLHCNAETYFHLHDKSQTKAIE